MANSDFPLKKTFNKYSRLLIFSSIFPFGKGEVFLGNELLILSRYFSEIQIFPLYNPYQDLIVRKLPDNVIYEKYLLDSSHFKRIIKGLINFSPLWPYIKDLCKLINKGSNLRYNLNQWFISLIAFRTFYSSKRLTLLKNQLREDDIIYFYWGLGQTQILKYLSHNKIFVRIHGGEIDFQRHYGYIPLIDSIILNTPYFLAISDLVKNRLIQEFNCNPQSVSYSPLGVYDQGDSPLPESSDRIRIVSCSNIYEIKRIHLIINALAQINDTAIEWVHFGGGHLLSEMEAYAEKLLNNKVEYLFKGKVSNNLIIDFYKNNYVDLFVNVSISEGVPVSIMEAMSFGIPCFATNVGATGELVNNDIGYLVEADFNYKELVHTINTVRGDFSGQRRMKVKEYWKSKYDAISNYEVLAIQLKQNMVKV